MIQREVTLKAPVPSELREEVLEKLAYCSEHVRGFDLGADGHQVLIQLDSPERLDEATEKVRMLVDSLVKGYRPVEKEIIFESRVTPAHTAPVWDELKARGLVFEEGPGQVSLLGETARLAQALDRRFVAMANQVFGATPHQYPTMLSMAAMDRCHYFTSFPQHVTFAPHIREDLEHIKQVQLASKQSDRHAFLDHLEQPRHVLSPAVCFHAYLRLADRPLPGPQTITACGRCFRYESRNFATLERVWDFSMREIIFVGPAQWIDERRQVGIEEARRLVEELGLDAWMETANDPFFLNNFVAKRYFQLMTRTKLELRLSLPYSGSSLAAASFNLHNDFFGKSFGITLDGGFASTGCIAFGIERWVWALYAQFGPELARWPAAVGRALEL